MPPTVLFSDLQQVEYRQAWALQKALHASIIQKKLANRKRPEKERVETQNFLLFCEHNRVFTLGKNGNEENLKSSPEQLKQRNIDFVPINRGGDITYHGPGQLTGYPIFDLDHFFTDIGLYLRLLEAAVIDVLSLYGIKGERIEGLTGVWLDSESPHSARKICAIGVHSSRWVTMHGFAFNICANLEPFDWIVPCGISDKGVTSLHLETENVEFHKVKAQTLEALKAQFNLHLEDLTDLDYWWEQSKSFL